VRCCSNDFQHPLGNAECRYAHFLYLTGWKRASSPSSRLRLRTRRQHWSRQMQALDTIRRFRYWQRMTPFEPDQRAARFGHEGLGALLASLRSGPERKRGDATLDGSIANCLPPLSRPAVTLADRWWEVRRVIENGFDLVDYFRASNTRSSLRRDRYRHHERQRRLLARRFYQRKLAEMEVTLPGPDSTGFADPGSSIVRF